MSGFLVGPDGLAVRGMDGRHFGLLENLPLIRPDGSKVIGLRGAQLSRVFKPGQEQTDGASTPPPVWSLGLPPFGWYWLPTVLHDLGYRRMTLPVLMDREDCDQMLREAMISMWPWALAHGHTHEELERQTAIIYEGVRLGGQASWDKDRSA